jgi:hypothetical protein
MDNVKCRRNQERKVKKNDNGGANVWYAIHDEFMPFNKEKAQITNYCEGGLGICTSIPLKPGKKIMFINKREELHLPDNGIVMWATQSSEGYHAGIKFV